VLLVSDACTDICKHMDNAMVHPVGDVNVLAEHINLLHKRRGELQRLRIAGLQSVPSISWLAAGKSLVLAYQSILNNC
jgi:hypothetical protein